MTIPSALPGFALLACLSALASRRCPALRPVAACFAAWSALDAVTGPPWLRAGVFVVWPGVAVCAAAWGLRLDGQGARTLGGVPLQAALLERRVPATPRGAEEIDVGHGSHPRMIPYLIAAAYLSAALVASASYPFTRAPYHALLPASRALAVISTLALLLTRPPRTWAALACALPAVGLSIGVIGGVWTLLPAGLETVREQWARLAGWETWLTMGLEVCAIAMALRESARGKA